MPAAVVAVAAAVGSAITAIGAGATAIAGAVAGGLYTAGVSAGIAAAVGNGILALGGAAGLGAAVNAWATVYAISASFKRPNLPTTSSQGSPVNFKADPLAPLTYSIGRTAVSGNMLMAQTHGDKNKWMSYIVALGAAGPYDGIESFQANQTPVTFNASTWAASGFYAGKMWQGVSLGDTPQAAALVLPGSFGGSLPEWTASHKISGVAHAHWVLEYDPKIYTTGVPKPMWVLRGAKVYDPRLDSTYPGGVGPQRASDRATWTWSENPHLHALTWAMGQYVAGKKVVGIGAPIDLIDVAQLVEGANICDANGWKIGGSVNSAMNPFDVYGQMLAAGGAEPMAGSAKLGCFNNAPKTSIATIKGDSIVGRVSVTATQPRRARINCITPTYRSEQHGWEYVQAEQIKVGTYISEDRNIERTREIRYDLVQSKDQAAQLAAYDIVNSREMNPLVLVLKLRWVGLQPGDAVTIDEPEIGLVSRKFVIRSRQFDPNAMTVTITLRSETDAKHDFALGRIGVAPPSPGLDGYDATTIDPPGAGAFSVNGSSVNPDRPTLTVTGASDNRYAAELLIRYRKDSAGDWNYWPGVRIDTLDPVRVEVSGVQQGSTYQVQTAYRSVRNVVSAWTNEGTAVAGSFDAAEFLSFSGKNLVGIVAWVPQGGATMVEPSTLGDSKVSWSVPAGLGGAAGVNMGAQTFGTNPFDVYSLQWNTVLTGGAPGGAGSVRVGFRVGGTGGATPIPGIADRVYPVSTTEFVHYWEGIQSSDPAWPDAEIWIFAYPGDVPAGYTLNIFDTQLEYAARSSLGWRPNPNDKRVLSLAGYLGALDATRNSVYVQSTTPAVPSNGDFWVQTGVTPVLYWVRQGGVWQRAAADGGSFGNNLYHTPGGTIATLGSFLTSSGISAGYSGQGPWGTYTAKTPTGALQYLGNDGKIFNAQGLGPGSAGVGQALVLSRNPLSSDTSNIYIASFNFTGFGGFFRSVPAFNFTGFPSGGTWHILYYWPAGGFGVASNSDIQSLLGTGNWVYIGTQSTAVSPGTFAPPPPPASGGYRGGGAAAGGGYQYAIP